MSTAALISLIAVLAVVIISMINEDLNVGILGIGLGILVGGIWANLTAVKIMAAWPIDLFMILVGVTFMFGIASTNGTM
jgi:hypothetical protein